MQIINPSTPNLKLILLKGRGFSFSIEIPIGFRFMIHSRLFKDEELAELEPVSFYEN